MRGLIAGRELDILVAEKVMGWTWDEGCKSWAEDILPRGYSFNPSENIEDAWAVVEKMIEKGFEDFNLDFEGTWECVFTDYVEAMGRAVSETAPHVICLAALEALEKMKNCFGV